MRIENRFQVEAPPDEAWDLLLDIPRVIPCMPGAALKETVGENHWRADVAVKLGPVRLSFDTEVTREKADRQSGTVLLIAKAREQRGRGGATATITSTLSSVAEGTQVAIVTDMTLTGAVARYARGLVEEVSNELVEQFAACLKAQLLHQTAEASGPASPPAAPPILEPNPPKPLGASLLFRALWHRILRPFQSAA